MRILNSLSAEKLESGGPFGIFGIHFVAKYQRNSNEKPLEILKTFRTKVSQRPKKLKVGTLLSRPVLCYV